MRSNLRWFAQLAKKEVNHAVVDYLLKDFE